MTHTLIIKAVANPNEVDNWRDFSIECPGVTDACRMWVECDIPNCGSEDAERDNNVVKHGKRHQLIVSTWSVPTDTCYLMIADELSDVAASMADSEKLPPGRYEVDHDFDEGMVSWLTPVKVAA
jgi:hypothetical protein